MFLTRLISLVAVSATAIALAPQAALGPETMLIT